MAIGSKKYVASGIKLAPPIQQAVIVAEKQIDQKTWFTIQVVPQQTDIRIVNGSPVGKRASSRHPYSIARRYEDFVQFAGRLREAFPTTTRSLASRAGSRLLSGPDSISIPKLNNGKRLIMNGKKRRSELDKFMQALFRLPPSISQSLVVLEFFGFQKMDEQQQQQQQQQNRLIRSQSSMTQQNAADFYSSSLRKSASHPDLSPVMPSMTYTIHPLDSPSFVEQTTPSTSPLWRRFRARARAHPQAQAPAPQPEPTVSTSSLTSLCSQAASMIMPWAGRAQQQPPPPSMMHHHQQPMCRRGSPHAQPRLSFSTPTGGRPPVRRPRKKSSAPSAYPPPLPRSTLVTSSSIISSTSTSSSCYSRDSQSTCATSIAPSPTTSPTLRMIKIKVIYDVDNIIVIQVPRSITLTDLRARIAQKFSDPSISLPKDFVLLFNDTRSSASSNTSAASSFSDSGMATLIAKEQDLTMAMGSTWVRHEKVTLRCVA